MGDPEICWILECDISQDGVQGEPPYPRMELHSVQPTTSSEC